MEGGLSYRIRGQEEGRAILAAVLSSAIGVKEGIKSFKDYI